MVTDGILCAMSMINEYFITPEAKQAGEDIWMMLADFDEDEWEEMNTEEKQEWVKGYVKSKE